MKIWLLIITQIFAFSALAGLAEPAAESAAMTAADQTMRGPPKPILNIETKTTFGDLQSQINQTNIAIGSCNSKGVTANEYCLANSNPDIHKGMLLINALLGAQGVVQSTSEGCQTYNKAMGLAKMALSGYSATCSAVQTPCQLSCSSAKSQIEATKTATSKYNNSDPGTMAAIRSEAERSSLLADQAIAKCESYKWALASAGLGLYNVIKESSANKNCEKKTTVADCAKNPNNPACAKAIDCSIAGNQNDVQCICQRAPNSPGCPGYNGQAGLAAPVGRGVGNGTNGADATGAPGVNIDGSDDISPTGGAPKPTAGGGSGSGSAGSGGGGGGLGSGNSAAGKNGAADGKETKALNPNILSGFDGGGGGGGSRGGGGGRPDSPYGAYMPGGSKDPSRNIASKTFGNGQVTGAGSKSNWEKVRERYVDNKPTLMGK